MHPQLGKQLWPVRLSARTPGFHPGKRGSIPLRATNEKINCKFRVKAINLQSLKKENGPFVYRLGRQVFILVRGVRFPYGLRIFRRKNFNREKMANHKSALKRIRNSETKRLRNKYQHKTTRNAIKKLREADKKEAEALFPSVVSMIDRLAKRNIIHDNKAANLKSKLAKHVAAL